MRLNKEDRDGFQKMFEATNILTNGTDDSMYWLRLRDRLVEATALEYLKNYDDECLFTAVQLCKLGLPLSEWRDVEQRLEQIRRGIKPREIARDWEGAWALVLQVVFRSNWEAQDELRRKFFENVRSR